MRNSYAQQKLSARASKPRYQLAEGQNFVILQAMDKTARIIEFISFCIEMYAVRNSISGADAYVRLSKFGVLDYLWANYEPLHTQGINYLLATINDFMKTQEIA